MALVLNDRVKETTTTTGTGAVALGGAVSKFETFAAGIGNSNTTYYAIVHRTAAEFEIGLGTLDADSSDLTRTTIISSSNSDSAVDFAAGTKDVFCTIPASKLVFEDASSNVNLPNDLVLGSDSAVLKFGADSDTTLTHTDGTGLTLNSTNKLLFRDTGLYINSSTDGQLDIVADSEIQIAATTIDINGAVALNGAITGATNITLTGELDAATLDISGNADIDGTLEADAITVNGTALATVIAGTTITDATNATNSAHVLVTDNENTNEENLIAFVEGATSSTGNVGLEMDGNFAYNPSTGTVSSTIFKGNIDAVDGDFDGTLEADAITIAGTAIGSIFSPIAGGSGILTTGALDTGSITSGFGNIDNGASNITNGGLVKLDVDSDADDVTGDSATGRLTIGAGEDLNLYHGGTNSYVVNDTGLLVLQSAGGVVVNENSANVDFRIESNGDANMFIVDGSANRIGMGVAAPSAPLHIFQAGSNSATTELLLLETGSSTDGSGVKLRMATADTSGILEMADGSGSFDSEFRFKLSDSSQLATPDTKFTIRPQSATFAVDLTCAGDLAVTGSSPYKFGQIIESTSIDTTAISSTSFSDIDLNVSITPRASSSKILVMIDFAYTQDGADNNLANIQMLRDSTAIGNHHVGYDNPGGNVGFGCHIQKLDSPGTTSEITYKTQANTQNASSQFRPVGAASIIAIEILA